MTNRDYTPSVSQLKSAWVNRSTYSTDVEYRERQAEFDRAIAAHDAKLRAETLREAASKARDMPPMFDTDVAMWLDRLATIAEGRP